MKRTGSWVPSFLMFFGLIVYSMDAFSASIQIQAQVDRKEISFGEALQYSLVVRTSSDDELNVQLPAQNQLLSGAFRDFEVENFSPSSGREVRAVLGGPTVIQKILSYNYLLRPKRTGELNVGTIAFKINGREYHSDSVAVIVLKPNSKPRSPNPSDEEMDPTQDLEEFLKRQFGMSPGMQNLGRFGGPKIQDRGMGPLNPPKSMKGVLQVWSDPAKTEVYVHEPLYMRWYIYTKGELLSLDRVAFPSLVGFWKEILDEIPAIQFFREDIGGEPVRRALLANHALFALSPGVKQIDSYKVKVTISVPRVNDPFFGTRDQVKLEKDSPPVEIHVKPIPEEGRPKSFTGGVGEFKMQSEILSNEFKVGEPFQWKLRFEGRGNAKFIEVDQIQLPPDFEIFDKKEESRFFKDGNSYKQIQLWVIPKKDGSLDWPIFEFSFFNPETKKFETQTSLKEILRVDAGILTSVSSADKSSENNQEVASSENKKLEPQGSWDPEPMFQVIKMDGVINYGMRFWGQAWVMYILALLCILIFVVVSFDSPSIEKSLRDEVEERWGCIQKLKSRNQDKEVAVSCINVLTLVLSRLTYRGGADLTLPDLLKDLPASLRSQAGGSIEDLSQKFLSMAFAPKGLEDFSSLGRDLSDLKKLIDGLISR